ncbi:MAG TPA: right-handed parallel beta-helix repeat-containing protein [Rudaea sp.]|nr:right-handed parallel beta-helix repeat-containing protein [Rudaea sp.]
MKHESFEFACGYVCTETDPRIIDMPLLALNCNNKSRVRIHAIASAVFGTALSVAGAAHAANLVVNSDFQNGLTGWSASTTGSHVSIALDPSTGSPSNDSAFLNAPDANATGTLSQCVVVSAPMDIDLIGRTLTNSSLGSSDLEIQMQAFQTSTCSGEILETQTASSLNSVPPWFERSLQVHPLPNSTNSVLISAFFKSGTGSMSAHVDHILFGPTGTTGLDSGLGGGGITCVNSMSALQQALTAALNDHQANYIKVESGTYTLSGALSIFSSDNLPLTIEGGYDTSCSTPGSGTTTITGAGVAGTYVTISSDDLVVRDLTFTAMNPPAGHNAVSFGSSNPYISSGPLRIENNVFKSNHVTGVNDSILEVYAATGVNFDDNLIVQNDNAFASLRIQSDSASAPIALVNNTVANNAGPGVTLRDASSGLDISLVNNIFWNNSGEDLLLNDEYVGYGGVAAINNTYLNCLNCSYLNPASENNSTSNPQLNGTTFAPAGTSPVINAGVPAPLVLPAKDVAGSIRVKGSAPDRGALETTVDDITSTSYLVTSANDSGPLTLRQAITDANAAGKPALINFNVDILDSTCGPHLITLNSPLPPIFVPMIIDGWSQPGSIVNTEGVSSTGEISSNASICIQIVGASGSSRVSDALIVPALASSTVHLEVRGIQFGNFNTAIELLSGVGSWIHGDAFGTVSGSTVGNGAAITIIGGLADLIGGPSLADVNTIGGASGSAAVQIIGTDPPNAFHVITNNDFGGVDASTYGNAGSAIHLQNTRYQTISGNWIAASGADGIYIDDSSSNLIQSNTIGGSGHANVGAGVHLVGGGSNDNIIGNVDDKGTPGANTISGNLGPGVWLGSDSGLYNAVNGNSISINGGIAIDVGALGPNTNTGDESSGPDDLLHKPFLTSANYPETGNFITVSGSMTVRPNTYRVANVYASSRCGDTAELLGTMLLQSTPAGVIPLDVLMPLPSFAPVYITVTETDYTVSGGTSEASNCKVLSSFDDIFNDSYDNF